MRPKSIYIAAAAAPVLVPLALFLHTFSASPLPKPEPYTGPLPSATPPPDLAVFSVVTGVNHRVTAFGYRGGSLPHHSSGLRVVTPYRVWKPAVDQMKAAGYDQKSLRAILLTHSHWDHVSGLPDFPGLPVWVTRQEHQFIRPGGQGQFGESFTGIRYEEYGFEGGPYLGFPANHDVYGDGSIVVVPAPGHTPGGVIIFVTLANGTRYAFVGDLVWQLEGITLREERPWITRKGSDADAEGNRENLLRMIALKERWPGLIIVPAHDMRPFAEMPALNSNK